MGRDSREKRNIGYACFARRFFDNGIESSDDVIYDMIHVYFENYKYLSGIYLASKFRETWDLQKWQESVEKWVNATDEKIQMRQHGNHHLRKSWCELLWKSWKYLLLRSHCARKKISAYASNVSRASNTYFESRLCRKIDICLLVMQLLKHVSAVLDLILFLCGRPWFFELFSDLRVGGKERGQGSNPECFSISSTS